jgi:hypothetical protein
VVHSPAVTRLAILVAPSDPLVSTAPARLEALGWLRNQLAPRGFQITIVGSGKSPLADLEKVAATISPGDSVLVHVTGRLVSSSAIALSPTTSLALPAIADLLAPRSPGYASLILDLVRGDDAGDDPDPDLLSETAQSLGTEERGYAVLASVRGGAEGADRIAFTRLVMPPVDGGGPPSGEALLSDMHDRAATDAGALTFLMLRGAPDTTIDGLVSQAMQALDWPRVAELRLDRVETLATDVQRAQELTSIARILHVELRDVDGAIEVLERARALDPKRPAVLEALRHAYEASGRAPPIDPAEYAKAFATHRRAGHADAALLDAMLLEEMGVADPEHLAIVEQSRSVGPMQALKPLDAAAWDALRAPGFDQALAALFAAVHDAAVAVRLEQLQSSRRLRPLDSRARLDAESTVSAVRTLHWAARVLGVDCPDLYPGNEDAGEAITHVPSERPSISLAPRVLSGTSAKQLAFLAGRSLTWYRPEYHCMLYYSTLDDLRELVGAALELAGIDGLSTTGDLRRVLARRLGADEHTAIGEAAQILAARGDDVGLEHWVRSAELTAARAGLFLCGELKTAVVGARSQSAAPGRPSAERVTSDLVAFCASGAHAALRAQFLRLPSHGP